MEPNPTLESPSGQWCKIQNALARAVREHFEKWPNAWEIYCGCGDRHRHPAWPDLDFGERLHVILYFQEDLIGDANEIGGQQFIGGQLALEYLLSHVRIHVACGAGYRRTCGCCDPAWPAPAGSLVADYREAKRVTTPGLLDQLAQRIARAKYVSGTAMVMRVNSPTSVNTAEAACGGLNIGQVTA